MASAAARQLLMSTSSKGAVAAAAAASVVTTTTIMTFNNYNHGDIGTLNNHKKNPNKIWNHQYDLSWGTKTMCEQKHKLHSRNDFWKTNNRRNKNNDTILSSTLPLGAEKSQRATNLRTRMTSIGRFSLRSETSMNPSVPTFFVALSGKSDDQEISSSDSDGGMSVDEFKNLWYDRGMHIKHPRFHSYIPSNENGFFEHLGDKHLSDHVFEKSHYSVPKKELQARMEQFLTKPLKINDKLWECQISSGPLGSSGTLSNHTNDTKNNKIKSEQKERSEEQETVVLFRSHHCIADGVSLGAALADLADEAKELQDMIVAQMRDYRRKNKPKNLLDKIKKFLMKFCWLFFGSIQSVFYQIYLSLVSSNPFDFLLKDEEDLENGEAKRNVSWCDAAPVKEAQQVAKKLYKKATINDVFVTCISRAIQKQLNQHHLKISPSPKKTDKINIVVPVHLTGGILLPGTSMGNRIGAFVARVPLDSSSDSSLPLQKHLMNVSRTLGFLKRSPTPLISYFMAKAASDYLPVSITQHLFRNANQNAVVVVSNVRGPEKELHWNGRSIKKMGGFVPLPPGIPIGITVFSYSGMVGLAVNADKRVVPDADLFLSWVLEEYIKLCNEANAVS